MLKGHVFCCHDAVGLDRINKGETGMDFQNQIPL